jgi:nucleoside-diphosphate-sugar epimerase
MKMKQKIVFVTGGSGFVGRNLIPLLLEKNYTVKALARSEKSRNLLKALGAIVIDGDLNNVKALELGVANCNSVFHLAASVDFFASEKKLTRIHVEATQLLIEKAQNAKVHNFIYLGAASVVTNGKPITFANETFISDNLCDGYSRTKLKAEQLVLDSGKDNFRTISLRPPLIWGKGDLHTLPEIVKAINNGQMMFINGGNHLFNTCHISNICHALLLAEQAETTGETYFITDDEDLLFKDFISKYVSTKTDKIPQKSISLKNARFFATMMEFVWKTFKLKNSPPIYNGLVNILGLKLTLDITKAKKELKYKPLKTVEQGLKEMAE